MAGDAVLPLDHAGGILSRVRLAQLGGHIQLGVSMRASGPLGGLSAMAGVALPCREGLHISDQANKGENSSEER
jgi:hypothetical protein